MKKLGYKDTFSVGAVAGSACLGMLIPPSILLIVWAILTEMSVGALFLAGIIPGIVLALLFAIYVIVAAKIDPALAPDPQTSGTPSVPLRRDELVGAGGIVCLIFLVIGGLWGGLFTPTEAAGFGAIGAILVGLTKGMTSRDLLDAIYQAGKTTAPIMFLLIAAQMYSRLLALGGAINFIQSIFLSIGAEPWIIIALMLIIWIILIVTKVSFKFFINYFLLVTTQ